MTAMEQTRAMQKKREDKRNFKLRANRYYSEMELNRIMGELEANRVYQVAKFNQDEREMQMNLLATVTEEKQLLQLDEDMMDAVEGKILRYRKMHKQELFKYMPKRKRIKAEEMAAKIDAAYVNELKEKRKMWPKREPIVKINYSLVYPNLKRPNFYKELLEATFPRQESRVNEKSIEKLRKRFGINGDDEPRVPETESQPTELEAVTQLSTPDSHSQSRHPFVTSLENHLYAGQNECQPFHRGTKPQVNANHFAHGLNILSEAKRIAGAFNFPPSKHIEYILNSCKNVKNSEKFEEFWSLKNSEKTKDNSQQNLGVANEALRMDSNSDILLDNTEKADIDNPQQVKINRPECIDEESSPHPLDKTQATKKSSAPKKLKKRKKLSKKRKEKSNQPSMKDSKLVNHTDTDTVDVAIPIEKTQTPDTENCMLETANASAPIQDILPPTRTSQSPDAEITMSNEEKQSTSGRALLSPILSIGTPDNKHDTLSMKSNVPTLPTITIIDSDRRKSLVRQNSRRSIQTKLDPKFQTQWKEALKTRYLRGYDPPEMVLPKNMTAEQFVFSAGDDEGQRRLTREDTIVKDGEDKKETV